MVRWLLNRDISAFNPKQPAPLTQFKAEMIGTSKSPLKHQIEDMIAAGDYPFNVDCVRSVDVAKAMRDRFSSKSIGSVLGEIGCIQQLCKRATGKREKLSLFAVRNLDEWRSKSPIKWIDEYDSRRESPMSPYYFEPRGRIGGRLKALLLLTSRTIRPHVPLFLHIYQYIRQQRSKVRIRVMMQHKKKRGTRGRIALKGPQHLACGRPLVLENKTIRPVMQQRINGSFVGGGDNLYAPYALDPAPSNIFT